MLYIWSHFAEHSTYWEEKHWCWKIKYLHFISIKYFFLSSQKIINIFWHFSRDDTWSVLWGEQGAGAVGGAGPQAECRPGQESGRGQMWRWSEIVNNDIMSLWPDSLRCQDMQSGAVASNVEPSVARLSCESSENSVRKWERESESKKGDKLPRQSLWLWHLKCHIPSRVNQTPRALSSARWCIQNWRKIKIHQSGDSILTDQRI